MPDSCLRQRLPKPLDTGPGDLCILEKNCPQTGQCFEVLQTSVTDIRARELELFQLRSSTQVGQARIADGGISKIEPPEVQKCLEVGHPRVRDVRFVEVE